VEEALRKKKRPAKLLDIKTLGAISAMRERTREHFGSWR
jgi:hypothetical protein